MRPLGEHLEKIRAMKKHRYHPLLHKIHKKHKISRKTLFYLKEYGPHTNVPKTIIKESIKILLLASVVSALGGFTLEHIKLIFVSIMPLVILLPALNDMIGDYGAIVSSRFSTMLHEGKIKEKWWENPELKKLAIQIFIIAILTTAFSIMISIAVSSFSGHPVSLETAEKICLIAIIDVVVLVSILFLTSIIAGLYFYKKNEDPNNFLIPIATSIADFGNMIILSVLIVVLF